VSFIAVSGTGWCLDTAIFAALVHVLHLLPFAANALSTATAILFVFAATHEPVFAGPREHRRRHLVYYVSYQVLLVATVSALLAALLSVVSIEPVVGKIALTPLTLISNYLAMSRIALTAGGRVPTLQ
jgi:putative flippase GtrA